MLFATPLAGTWSFALDPDNRGTSEAWFKGDLDDTITLPGSVDEARKASANPEKTMAHLTRRHPYVGPAWYARDFEVPADQEGLFHTLVLERPHGEVNVYLDGFKIGRDRSLSSEHRFLLGALSPGRHRLVLMIDNARFEAVGEAIQHMGPGFYDVAHSNTDHTQTNWNGVVGDMRVEAAAGSIARMDIDARSRQLAIAFDLEAFDSDQRYPTFWTREADDRLRLTFDIAGRDEPVVVERPFAVTSAFTPLTIDVELPAEAPLWDEFDPAVHSLTAEWMRDGDVIDRRQSDFGIRDFTRAGRRLTLNGRPVFLRGTLDCCIFPLTGYPPTDHAGWRKVFETVKAYGLNHVRFHSYCPPEAAFEVADAMGLLLAVESPVWPRLHADPNLDDFIWQECERIFATYGNHPSFVMFAIGNELHGEGLHAFASKFVRHWRERDPRRLYTGGSGWPTTPEADYDSKPEPRCQAWGEELDSRLNAHAFETLTDWSHWRDATEKPLLTHESGQWCVYPNFAEIEKYTGVLAPRNLEMVRDDLAGKGRLDEADELLMASGTLQTLLYKEDMEAALRTKDFVGTQLLGLQDFTGQGTALVGVVDAFWEEKPHVTPQRFREFSAPVVPLVRSRTFVCEQGEPIEAQVQIAHYDRPGFEIGRLEWSLLADGVQVAGGELTFDPVTTGDLHDAGSLTIPTDGLEGPGRYELVVSVPETDYRNRWSYWVFPRTPAAELSLVPELDDDVLARVAGGETIVFAPAPEAIRQNSALGFTSIFWNTLWTRGQAPHTLGLLNDTAHPVFAHFPSGPYSDFHWWELVHGRRALEVDGLETRRIVRVVDDWNSNRDLALLAECRVGAGRLILCGFDLETDLEGRPVARCMRNALAAHAVQPAGDAPALEPETVLEWWRSRAGAAPAEEEIR